LTSCIRYNFLLYPVCASISRRPSRECRNRRPASSKPGKKAILSNRTRPERMKVESLPRRQASNVKNQKNKNTKTALGKRTGITKKEKHIF
jgi:hypothetical protein